MPVLYRPSSVVQKMELNYSGVPGKDPISLKVQLSRIYLLGEDEQFSHLNFIALVTCLLFCFCHSFSRYSPSNCCSTILFVCCFQNWIWRMMIHIPLCL